MCRPHGRRWLAVLCAGAAAFGLCPRVAFAQAEPGDEADPLPAARALFAEALRDEDAGRFAEALDEFRRVRAVRDTPSIEYRIGTACEGLGRDPEAFAAYRAAEELAESNAQDRDVLRAATERLGVLAPRVGRLALVLPGRAPPGARVEVDGTALEPAALREPIPLAPGRHVVRATVPGGPPFASDVSLPAGAQVSLSVQFPPPPAEGRAPPLRGAGWAAIAGGAALVGASAVLWILRHDDIADLNRACPGGVCPPGAPAASLESTRSRALVEGPVAAACGAAGVLALGFGVLATTGVFPFATRGGGGLAIAGELP